MKGKILFMLICLFPGLCLTAQFKFDNISYKTVYINDLCDSLQKNPGYLLLDVRSKGEYYDTSSAASLNIGHLKNAVNLDIQEKDTRWKELLPYKDKPIFIYCSHSQRSRVFSKFLADSGFTRIINVNGAMTEFNLLKNSDIVCSKDLYVTSNKFSLISPPEVEKLVISQKDLFILDVRADSVFRGISTDAQENAQGKLKGAVNIPFDQLANSLDKIPQNRPILVIADFGRETNLAAAMLKNKGYTRVYAAFNGMNQWLNTPASELPKRKILWQENNAFTTITAEEMNEMLVKSPGTFILDARTREEFSSQVKQQTWKNRGHVLNAVNIPASELEQRWSEIAPQKNKDIILYTFGTNKEVFEAANLLASKGFTRLYVLMGGLFDIRWKAANLKGLSPLMKWVVDVPPDNL
jgi:rhodanese-related sulfurtransferase